MSVYPYRSDEDALALLPALAAATPGGPHWLRMVRPTLDLDEQVGCLVEAFADIESATGPALDLVGMTVQRNREGLDDREYRRIVACRLVSRWGTGAAGQVLSAFRALIDDNDATLTEDTPYVGFTLVGRIWWRPTSAWMARARAELASVVQDGMPYTALARGPNGARYGEAPGYGVGTYAFDLSRGF